MFLRKLFSSKNKFTWVLIDLIIVIFGVYIAFALQNRAEASNIKKEKDKVFTALKYELEYFRYRMYETKLGMSRTYSSLKEFQSKNKYNNFSNYRFIEPQYDYQTIQYSIGLQNTDIIDFELYDVLQSLFVEIKKIEHVERLLTETAQKYKSVPPGLKKKTAEFLLIDSENKDNFDRFLILIFDRSEISERVSLAASEALNILNDRLGETRARTIEENLIKDNITLVADSKEQAIALANKFYPEFTEDQIARIYEQMNKDQK